MSCLVAAFCLLVLQVGCDSKEQTEERGQVNTPAVANSDLVVGGEESQEESELSTPEARSETSEPAVVVVPVGTLDDAAAGDEAFLLKEIPDEPYVLDDPRRVRVREGVTPPLLGTTIYPVSHLPDSACGKFWIFYGDGLVEHMYVCNHKAGHH